LSRCREEERNLKEDVEYVRVYNGLGTEMNSKEKRKFRRG
jgi:hypothetical protein